MAVWICNVKTLILGISYLSIYSCGCQFSWEDKRDKQKKTTKIVNIRVQPIIIWTQGTYNNIERTNKLFISFADLKIKFSRCSTNSVVYILKWGGVIPLSSAFLWYLLIIRKPPRQWRRAKNRRWDGIRSQLSAITQPPDKYRRPVRVSWAILEDKIKIFRFKCLGPKTKALYNVSNDNLHIDLPIPTVQNVARIFYKLEYSSIHNQLNPLISEMSIHTVPGNRRRRLKRSRRRELLNLNPRFIFFFLSY